MALSLRVYRCQAGPVPRLVALVAGTPILMPLPLILLGSALASIYNNKEGLEREREKLRSAHGALPATVTAQPPKLPQCLKALINHVNRTWTDLQVVRQGTHSVPATVTAQPPMLPQHHETLIDYVNRT